MNSLPSFIELEFVTDPYQENEEVKELQAQNII